MTRRERLADIFVIHAFDNNAGARLCGVSGSGWELAGHLADEVEVVLGELSGVGA